MVNKNFATLSLKCKKTILIYLSALLKIVKFIQSPSER